jgi:hypothetical protein
MTGEGRAGEDVLLTGGKQVAAASFAKAAGGVYTASLPAAGVPVGSYGGASPGRVCH